MPQAHSGRERQIEILLIQVFGLYVDGLFVHGEQSHLAFIFGGFNAFHVLVVLRAEYVREHEGIIVVEWQGSIEFRLRKEREERFLQRLVRVAHIHQRNQSVE